MNDKVIALIIKLAGEISGNLFDKISKGHSIVELQVKDLVGTRVLSKLVREIADAKAERGLHD